VPPAPLTFSMMMDCPRIFETHELPAIIAAVLGVVVALSVLMVVGGYLYVTP
jgi:hypothetical protein